MLEIQVTLEDHRWSRLVGVSTIRSITKSTFFLLQKLFNYRIARGTTVEISVVLTNDKSISLLNRDHRNINSPTNVLSFPIYEREFNRYLRYEKYLSLGDIVLSIDTIERESLEQNLFLLEHLSHLIIHSLLHLLGFDHVNDNDAEDMEKVETVLLHRLGNLVFGIK